MGKVQYLFPLETCKDNRGLGAGGQAMHERGYSPCLHSLADWVAEIYFIVVAREEKPLISRHFAISNIFSMLKWVL